jgi:hypothetical protein
LDKLSDSSSPGGDPSGDPSTSSISYEVTPSGNRDREGATTTLTFTFDKAVSGLTAEEITIVPATVTKGAIGGSGTEWTLGVTVTVTKVTKITVSIKHKEGDVAVDTEGHEVQVYKGLTWTGTTWEINTNTPFTVGHGIAYGGASGSEKFVAVGDKGGAAYSSDGIEWQNATGTTTVFGTSTYDHIYGIAYGGGRFVAVGTSNKAAYSTDGINWQNANSNNSTILGTSNTFYGTAYGIAYGGASGSEKFVAVGHDPYNSNYVAYSTDGTNWAAGTGITFEQGDVIYGIAYGGGKFVAVGAKGKAA